MKKWMVLSAHLLAGTTCFAGAMGDTKSPHTHDGFFLGIGTNYNSININQSSWGKGISQITAASTSNGVGQGNGVPFHNTTETFAPEIQGGYLKHFTGSPNLYGVKFSYQYLGANATNSDLYIPQLGQSTNASGVTSSLFGWVDGKSIQVTTNHELSLIALIGRSFGNKYFYVGAGPSLFNLKSQNYDSIGYAEFDGAQVNITGLVNYSSPSIWAWGGAAQVGMSYFIDPTWFIDTSYTYAITGNNTTTHQQNFANQSQIGTITYNTSGTLYTRDTLSISTQSVTISINKIFDI